MTLYPDPETAPEVEIEIGGRRLAGFLEVPHGARCLIVFAHGTGSGRFSPRNQLVAQRLREAGFGTLLFDLLSREEEAAEQTTGHLRFDVDLLSVRLRAVTDWVRNHHGLRALSLGYFGSSTGAAAALLAAARGSERLFAIVSRGGRPDLAGDALADVRTPTLLIVGGADPAVLRLNREAFGRLRCEKRLDVVPDATHLFEEPGALESVASRATEWFALHALRARPVVR